jgi:hypothetical protein
MTALRLTTAAAVGLLLGLAPLAAQRPFAATYDAGRQVTLRGAVTRIDWVNPRAFFVIDVRDTSGTVTNWAVEFGNPLELERNGWSRSALGIGDEVTVEGTPARGTTRQAFARTVVTSRGARLFTSPGAPATPPPPAPAPRWPDGRVRLGPPPGDTGYWDAASASTLTERTGAPIRVDDDGLLFDLADADRVAPLQPWAKAVYLHRQRTLLVDDPASRCLPPGGPRQFQTPHGFQFIEQRELGRILVLFGGGNRNWRVIHTDGRPQGQPAGMVLSYYGHSIGWWENDDTLVVDAIGFNERFWLTRGGLPHADGLHLVERFSRLDLDTLTYEVTIDDPRTYTRPWTGGWTIRWVRDREIEEFFCEENAESTFAR